MRIQQYTPEPISLALALRTASTLPDSTINDPTSLKPNFLSSFELIIRHLPYDQQHTQ